MDFGMVSYDRRTINEILVAIHIMIEMQGSQFRIQKFATVFSIYYCDSYGQDNLKPV